jgi:hypothetical protein
MRPLFGHRQRNTAIQQHRLRRTSDGTFVVFDPPGSQSTSPKAISPAGTVTGDFFSPDFFPTQGFVGRPKNMR